ncbi:MAG: FliH/SctL family protein [Thermoflexaceae bacterium]|nr:FliH/SctL family protein [Thermoflexaceae bacterium]
MTRSLSNLLKGFYTRQTEERVIDYNEIISDKIESFRHKMEADKVEADGFVSGLKASVVEDLISEGSEVNPADGILSSEDALSVLVADNDETKNPVNHEELRELAGNIISDANAKADEIIANAKKEAEEMKKQAYEKAQEEGRQAGYEEGSRKAEEEYQVLINDANSELQRLEQEYTTRYNSMESEIVNVLLEVFSKVTRTIAEDNREVVLHLINQVMNHVEATGDFLIRVSKEDYPFLVENQGKIYCASPKDINISVMEDPSLAKNQCIIETDGGVFDCSLDIQLEQLIKNIKLLSCI